MSIKSVLITGANRGIGLEFVKQFAALPNPPHHVFATCRNPEKAEELQAIAKSNRSVNIIKLEMKDYDSFASVAKQVSDKVGENGLNLLINNAGILLTDSLDAVTREHMMENFEVNVVSPLMFAKEMLPLIKKAAGKSDENTMSCSRAAVVNITSKVGSMDDNTSGGLYPYRTSKAALNMVSKSMSVDLKSSGILVLALHPGWVQTDMGGPRALITTVTSVQEMIKTIQNANEQDTGFMLNYNGDRIPW